MGNSLSMRLRGIFQNKKEESWWERVTENARAFFVLRGARAFVHEGAGAFNLLEVGPAPGTRQRQAGSLVVHAVVIAALLWAAGHPNGPLRPQEFIPNHGPVFYAGMPPRMEPEKPGGHGVGGYLGVLPPTAGEWARRSESVVLHPRIPDGREHALPIEPTVSGAEESRHVMEIGLPSMKEHNNSNGPGHKDGIGPGGGVTMGNKDGYEEGETEYNGSPGAGFTKVQCLYCPDPEYTDEARHEKLQGSVTLRVLVTADGRAGKVKILRGLGFGLDERAMDKVRVWRFEPARDTNRRAIAQWITVEATYRLF
jgi:protein TonB